MKVLVTGGTGFVGSHIVVELLDAGHEVRLLVRRPEQVDRTFSLYAQDRSGALRDVLVGDARDDAVVHRSVIGCDAVVHAAAVYSLDPRRVDEVLQTNEAAARTVLGAATAQGLDPVVHISSTVALTGGHGGGPDLRLGDEGGPYAVSKRRSELFARQLQDAGEPVFSVYPGGSFGPVDPYLSDHNERLRWLLRGLFPLWPPGGFHVNDVRTVGLVVAALLDRSPAQRRFVVPGWHLDAALLYGTAQRVTGHRYPHVVLPRALVGPMTAATSAGQRVLPSSMRYPADHEGAMISRADTRMDDTAARLELGIEPPPFEKTIRDTAAWMAGVGHISRRAAGRAVVAADPHRAAGGGSAE